MNAEIATLEPELGQRPGFGPAIRTALTWRFAAMALLAASAGAGIVALFSISDLQTGPAFLISALLFAGIAAAVALIAFRAANIFTVPAETLLGIVDAERHASVTAGSLAQGLRSLTAAATDQLERESRRTADLARARDEAQTANVAKSQFLANMSHQLRTPLNAIIGYTSLLQEDAIASDRADQVADLGRVLQASRNLLELVNDMLELSKLEVGKTSFQRTIVDIGSLVQSVVTSFDLEQHGNGNLFDVHVEPGIGILVGDGGKIRQCLLNLVSNALKFTRGGRVELSTLPATQNGIDLVQFVVSDTGDGMSAEEVAALFRDLRSDGGDGGSSGPKLGLAIAHRLATMMGGSVAVRSVPGRGSVFTLTIPREMPRTIMAEDVLPFVEKGSKDQAEGRERKALIIDDDASAVDLMGRWLARLGYGIVAAEDGKTGIKLAREQKPDLIILDILMPDVDGYQVLEALRADEDISSIPVVVVSVCDDRGAALRAGATEALMKPVQPKLLEQVLDVYCKQLEGDILVIEDDPDSGALIQRTAAQVGLGSRVARDGEEGLAMIRSTPPAAIVLDLGLPGMSGFQVLEELGADSRLKRIPVLIVSGREISVLEHQAIERSGSIFHPKGNTSPREIANSLKLAVSR